MAQTFDVATKQLLDMRPLDWLRLARLPLGATATPFDVDLSTVTTEADRIFRVEGGSLKQAYLAHLEAETMFHADEIERWLRYNVLASYKFQMLVRTAVLLLRRQADNRKLTGLFVREDPEGGEPLLTFRYDVIRVWQLPVEELLQGGLATLPLAPISAVKRRDLPQVIRAMEARIKKEAPSEQAGILWTSAFALMGLRYPADLARQIVQGVQGMEDSVTYQWIVAKGLAEGRAQGIEQGREEGIEQGRVREARSALRRFGRKRLGEPTSQTIAALEAIASIERLEQLMDRISDVETWDELLVGA